MSIKKYGMPVFLINAFLVVMLIIPVGAVFAKAVKPHSLSRSLSTGRSVAEDNTRFAFDLYSKICAKHKGDNILISPLGISAALAMTYAGARGHTEKQMALALRSGLQQAAFHPAFSSLLDKMEGHGSRGHELFIANALWGQKGQQFDKAFLSLTRRYYRGGFREADFASDTQGSRKAINLWVRQNTGGNIKEVLDEGDIDSNTRLVLTNAVYFKGEWASNFKVKETRPSPFHISPGKDVNAQMMSQTGSFPYIEVKGLQIIELPYEGGDFSMVVLLPVSKDGLLGLEAYISPARLKDWFSKLNREEVEVALPKFKFETRYYLRDSLKEMGMPDAFGARADFSGIDGKKDLFLAAVVHQALIRVDEEGTEAAAATFSTLSYGIPITFKADHPFMFLILHKPTGSILFLGRVTNPQQ